MWRGKEEAERATKEKVDGWNTWSNWNEAGGTKRRDERKETMEKACNDGRPAELLELTAQGMLPCYSYFCVFANIILWTLCVFK